MKLDFTRLRRCQSHVSRDDKGFVKLFLQYTSRMSNILTQNIQDETKR
jgi:hypothetical protein